MVPRRIFEHEEKVAGGCRRLLNEELCNLYTSSYIIMHDKIKEDEMGRYVSCMEDMRNEYKILVREPEGKRPLGRPRHICEGFFFLLLQM